MIFPETNPRFLHREVDPSAKVGTVEQVTETGNIVIDDHGALLYERESMFLTCAAKALRELPARTVQVQDETGAWVVKTLGGPTMPAVQIEVGRGQSLDTLDAEDIQSYMTLVSMLPQHRRGYARFAHIDPDVINQIEADERAAFDAAMRNPQPQPQAGQWSAEMVPPQQGRTGAGPGRPASAGPNGAPAMRGGSGVA